MPKSPGRKNPRARRAPARARKSKRARPARWRSGLRLAWELLPLFALAFVALAAFMLDPAALARLAWACVSGTFGLGVQVTASVTLIAGAAAVIWAFWPEAAEPERRRASARTAAPRRPRQTAGRTRSAPARASRSEPASPAPEAAAPEPATAAVGSSATPSGESESPTAGPTPPRKPRGRPRNAKKRPPGASDAATTAAE